MATERLQAAIAKARAERDRKEGSAVKAPPPAAVPDPDPIGWEAIPRVSLDQSRLERNRILSLSSGRQATPFDILRTRVLQRMREHGWTRLAITSPRARCGKSTLSLNLAFGMARQPTRRIVSLEMDMRRPSHEKLLGIPRKDRSVARFLTGHDPLSVAAVRGRSNLILALNSHTAENASDVLVGDTVTANLSRLYADLAPDIVLLDMPPLLATDDAMSFLEYVDCTMIVAAAGETTIKDIDHCERLIAQESNVLGVVLNKCRHGESSASYEYY